jgi:hypothetical protein
MFAFGSYFGHTFDGFRGRYRLVFLCVRKAGVFWVISEPAVGKMWISCLNSIVYKKNRFVELSFSGGS